ncbi:MAG: hypothetical protein ACYTFA_17130, partial [Planctomycetota bacterium]
MNCTRCNLPNPAQARFCEGCGAALPVAGHSRAPSAFANFALVVAVVVSLAAASAALEPLRYPWQSPGDDSGFIWDGSARIGLPPYGRPSDEIRRSYSLCERNADAMYKLLAPRDIEVIVSTRDGGISIKGTPWELSTVDRFVELITRKEHQDKRTVRAYIDHILETSNKVEEYKLPRRKSVALRRILAFDDVPVMVLSDSGEPVTVQATAQDQETIRRMVDILRGKRRWGGCGSIRCWLGWHSPHCLSHARDALLEAETSMHDAMKEAKVLIKDGLHQAETVIKHLEVPELSDLQIQIGVPSEPPADPRQPRHQRKPDHPHDCPGC